MKNQLTELFNEKKQHLLNIFCTAGYPHLDSTTEVILALQANGVDMVEVGMPYSDPVADGPVIQDSSAQALKNGMTISLLFQQLESIRSQVHIPIILMGYINPVMQYGIEAFCRDASAAGVSGLILPDLPFYEYEKDCKAIFEKYQLSVCFLVSPSSTNKRIKQADQLTTGFLYAVSSSSTTGSNNSNEDSKAYFEKLAGMTLKNKLMIGFGIKDRKGFEATAAYASGAIIGTAYIKHIANEADVRLATATFVRSIRGN
jgi:tryptophan synthase alpha chain